MSDQPDDLLPGASTDYERAHSMTSARLLETDTPVIRRSRDPAQARADFLPFHAAERALHHYSGNEATRRARVAAAFDDHLAYGSPDALENEIALDTGLDIRIVEAFEEPGMTFPDFVVEAQIEPGDPVPAMGAALASAIRRKNVRDMPRVRVRVAQPVAALNIGAATHVSTVVRILPVDAAPAPPQIHVGAFVRMMPRLRILPIGDAL